MLSKLFTTAAAMAAVFCFCVDANAQSGSRGAAPSFSSAPSLGSSSRGFVQAPSLGSSSRGFSSAPTNVQPAPTTTFAAPGSYQPAATPLDTIRVQSTSPRAAAPVAQPFATSGCVGCQANAAVQTVSQPQTYYSPAPAYAPTYQAAPIYQAAPAYSSGCSSCSGSGVVYSQPAPIARSYTPVRTYTRSFAPAQSSCGCGR